MFYRKCNLVQSDSIFIDLARSTCFLYVCEPWGSLTVHLVREVRGSVSRGLGQGCRLHVNMPKFQMLGGRLRVKIRAVLSLGARPFLGTIFFPMSSTT